jgi:hypothetical protein
MLADRPLLVAAPSCGGRPHLGQFNPAFTLRLLMRQLGSKHTFPCEPHNTLILYSTKPCLPLTVYSAEQAIHGLLG